MAAPISERHRFHLVVDELHPYRGTSGTEVGLLLRKLFHRIGVVRPEQLVVVGASASLGADEPRIRAYLQEFFGRPASRFQLYSGRRELPDPTISPELSDGVCEQLAALADRTGEQQRGNGDTGARLAVDHELGARLINGCRREEEVIAAPAADLAAALDPHDADRAPRTLTGALSAIAAAGILPVRAHLFFRTSAGWWACSDPTCGAVDRARFDDPARPVGKIYPEPRIRCECGARCLDLLCCQTCGELLLGGYSKSPTRSAAAGSTCCPTGPTSKRSPTARSPTRPTTTTRSIGPTRSAAARGETTGPRRTTSSRSRRWC